MGITLICPECNRPAINLAVAAVHQRLCRYSEDAP